jgi:acetyl-CoA acyltransferase 2
MSIAIFYSMILLVMQSFQDWEKIANLKKREKVEKIYLLNGKRTPFGKFGGGLKNISPVDLAVLASKAVLEELSIGVEKIDQAILANVIPSTTDTMYGGRHLILKLGAPNETPGYCVNRLCGSGIEVIFQASNLIKLGRGSLILASGTENMSLAPHLTYGGRFGTKYGALQSADMLLDALTDKYVQIPMGITAENLADQYSVGRDECDEFSYHSHMKAVNAYKKNLLQGEITPVEVKKTTVERDEHIRFSLSLDDMRGLRPTFKKDGVVTAASASGVVDGAASVLVAGEKFCNKEGINPIAEIVDCEVIGVDPKIMGIGPVPAIQNLLNRNKLKIDEVGLFEINEAFAPQTLACVKHLELDMEKLNIWGGEFSFGHPLGATGVRTTLTLARQMKQTGVKWGIASACIGGGQGIAILLKN